MTGGTRSTDFPGQESGGTYLLPFVVKLNRAGSALIYSTNNIGVGNCDYGYNCSIGTSIAVDRGGSAYVAGWTTLDCGASDGFYAKFDSLGTLVYSSLLGVGDFCGGGTVNGSLTGNISIAVDGIGNAYVGGASTRTYNTNVFPALRLLQVGPGGATNTYPSYGDVFVTKIIGN